MSYVLLPTKVFILYLFVLLANGRDVDVDLDTFEKEFNEISDLKAKEIEARVLKETEKQINEQVSWASTLFTSRYHPSNLFQYSTEREVFRGQGLILREVK